MTMRRRTQAEPTIPWTDAIANIVTGELGHRLSDREAGEIAQGIAAGIARLEATRVKPSDFANRGFVESVARERVDAYLVGRGWRFVGSADRDVRWYDHASPPQLKSGSTLDEGFRSAANIPNEIADQVADPAFLVKTVPATLAGYVGQVLALLADLERHEDRWRGAILEDIMRG